MSTHALRRLVLELGHGPIDTQAMHRAAEFARDFGLELLGVYTEDEALLQLAGFPFARELRLLTHDWQPLDPGRVVAELHGHAETMRRDLRALLDRMGISGGFEVRRGDPVYCVAGVCAADDAIVVTATATPRRTRVEQAWVAAEQSPAAVLVLPDRPMRHGGPVVVVTDLPTDPGVALARRFAERQRARLLIFSLGDWPAEQAEVRRLAGSGTEDVLRALALVRDERLVVITRAVAGGIGVEGASRIAAAGMVPVLAL